VDLIEYGKSEWETKETTSKGYNRGINPQSHSRIDFVTEDVDEEYKLCVVYHLLSINYNMRIRIKCNLSNESLIIPSVTDIFASADWYEREAYDLFGVLFEGHQDLRRILTDYGFIGHPFRKKFPLVGNTQVTYDPEQKKVINVPVDISPRTLVPKVIRKRK
jgi:NADH-quinone oxidoreductase subunit C